MSYHISYDNGSANKKASRQFAERRRILFRFFVVLMICAACVCALGGYTGSVMELVLPGDADTTKNAFYTMTEEIKAGASFKEAIAAFCRVVLKDVPS